MNILIQFEDTYGCYSLFNYASIGINCVNVTTRPGLGNSRVFKVTKSLFDRYDMIVIVFDLDDDCDFSITSKTLLRRLGKNIIDDNGNLTKDSHKLILVPVFCCFETLYLFSKYIRNSIGSVDVNKTSNESEKLIALFKEYYDYSLKSPEDISDIASQIHRIRNAYYKIKEVQLSKRWFPQRFHFEYARQSFKLLLPDVKDDYLGKRTDLLFNYLKNNNKAYIIDSIIDGIGNMAEYNIYIYKLIKTEETADLINMALDKNNLKEICSKLDDFNAMILQPS